MAERVSIMMKKVKSLGAKKNTKATNTKQKANTTKSKSKALVNNRKMTLGCTFVLASVLYFVFLLDVQTRKDLFGYLLFVLDGMLFVSGTILMANSREMIRTIIRKTILEIFSFIATVISVMEILYCLSMPFGNLKWYHQIFLLFCITEFSWYLIRCATFAFSVLKQIVTKTIEVVSGKELKEKSENIDALLKNIVSIATTLAVIYAVLEKLFK